MSKFSGKCDLYDSLISIREVNDETTDWSKISIFKRTNDTYFDKDGWHNELKLNINSIRDLIPYAPFVSGMSYGSNDGVFCAHIGSHSYIDEMEKERLSLDLDIIKKYYRKCKRAKQEFDFDGAMKKVMSFDKPKKYQIELYNRVKEHPTSANIIGLRDERLSHYRDALIEEMIKYDYTREQATAWAYDGIKTW